MPLGIISDEEFALDIAPPQASNVIHMPLIPRGRGTGKRSDDIPHTVRAFAAIEANEGALNKDVAQTLGISIPSVAAYKNGATSTSTYNKPDEALKEVVDDTRERIANKAQRKLMMALSELRRDKLEGADARTISGVAKDMASVYDKMQPKADINNRANVAFIIMQPPMKSEKDYLIIDVDPVD
jgi:predicted transcriptional regulator